MKNITFLLFPSKNQYKFILNVFYMLRSFDKTWNLTSMLFSAFKSKNSMFLPPPHNLRHPLIFYYLHPGTLYLNKLKLTGVQMPSFYDKHFENYFITGVDETLCFT